MAKSIYYLFNLLVPFTSTLVCIWVSLMYSFHFFKVANVRALLPLPAPFLLLLDNVDLKDDVILTSIVNC